MKNKNVIQNLDKFKKLNKILNKIELNKNEKN